jgi:hypothetical protein
MVAPSDGWVKVADEVCREFSGEGFAVEFGREAGGEVLEHDEADEDGVAGRPGGWLVAKEAKFQGEVGALKFDGGIDTCCVAFELVKLVGWERGEGAVSRVAEFEGALEAVVGEKRWTEDLSEGSCSVAAEGIHLPEAVLGGDEALREE